MIYYVDEIINRFDKWKNAEFIFYLQPKNYVFVLIFHMNKRSIKRGKSRKTHVNLTLR